MEELRDSILLSLRVALIATCVVVLIGVPCAYFVARKRFPGRSLVEALLTLPLVLPPTVVGYGLVMLLGNRGPLGSIFRPLGVQFMFTELGAVTAAAVVGFPLLFLPAKSAFQSVEREMEDVARLMGAGTLGVFWHVSLPLARRGIASGVLLAFARALGEFGATVMVFGQMAGRRTLPLSVYNDYLTGDIPHALPAVGILLCSSLVLIVVYNRWWGRPE